MSLNIVVCIKSVVTRATGTRIVRTPELSELNSFDRPAIETALLLRETHGGSVTALTMGPPDAGGASLAEAMAMGVDRGVLLSDRALIGSDTLATSTALGAAIKKIAPVDLVLFGTRTSDSDTGQVGPQTATLLHIPMVTGVNAIEKAETGFQVKRTCDEFVETFAVELPAAMTMHPSSVVPRDIPLAGIERAFAQGELLTLTLEDIGLKAAQVGELGSGTKVIKMSRVPKGRTCDFIEGSVAEQTDELLKRLQNLSLVG
jgi:electron transfer flavoprotein beta subunit